MIEAIGTLPFFDCFRWLPVDAHGRDLPALASVFDYDISSNGFPIALKRERGIESHGRAGNPGFMAPERGDFRLIPGALAATSACVVTDVRVPAQPACIDWYLSAICATTVCA